MCVHAWVTPCLIHLCLDALALLAHLHTLAPTQTRVHTAGKSRWLDPPACSTFNPQPSTLNPQPSTLNGRQKLLARSVGMFKNKSLVVSVSHLPLSLCVRTNGHACSRLAACALKRLLRPLPLEACLPACVCCRTKRTRHARESTHSSTNSLHHDKPHGARAREYTELYE